jgi:hypothetical protein
MHRRVAEEGLSVLACERFARRSTRARLAIGNLAGCMSASGALTSLPSCLPSYRPSLDFGALGALWRSRRHQAWLS